MTNLAQIGESNAAMSFLSEMFVLRHQCMHFHGWNSINEDDTKWNKFIQYSVDLFNFLPSNVEELSMRSDRQIFLTNCI